MMHNNTMRTIFFLTILLLLLAQNPMTHQAHGHTPLASTASKDLVVTSDSNHYCEQLNSTLSEKIRLPHGIPVRVMDDAQNLQKQGTTLCHHHHVRAGIGRLRRALLLLNQHKGQN